MKLKAFEAHYSCGHFKPNNIKNGSVVKKLSWKNLGVSIKLFYTVYNRPPSSGVVLPYTAAGARAVSID